jgi:ceramide kinase
VYETSVLPLFQQAKITLRTIYTERANHAQDFIEHGDLHEYDGIICVGGDGIFSELCHGLLLRTAREAQLNVNDPQVNLIRPKLRIGIIPAGSTDAVVFGTTGLNDPITSALQIIVGESLSIDIATVNSDVFTCLHTCLSFIEYSRFITSMDSYVSWVRCLPMDFSVILSNNQINGVP